MRKFVKWCATAVVLAPLSVAGYIGFLQLSGNFHEVVAGQLYRSSQPNDAQLTAYIRDHNIKTVINLRGENDRSSWYKSEVSTSQMYGVRHIDFGMSARKLLTPERVAQLIDIMRDAPKPILIHCKSGSDRTGLASAIYVNKVAGMDEETAEQQLSLRFGHIGIPHVTSTYAMDQTWEEIEATLPVKAKDTPKISAQDSVIITANNDA